MSAVVVGEMDQPVTPHTKLDNRVNLSFPHKSSISTHVNLSVLAASTKRCKFF